MRIVVATTNPGKLRELERLLPDGIELVGWATLGIDPPDETGQSFLDNAIIKATHAAATGLPAIADDSGLEVDALGGRPGVLSARFAGPDATDADNNALLVEKLRDVEPQARTARYRCAVALALPDGQLVTAVGALEGRIVEEPRGSEGFGYDPYFEVHDAAAPEVNGRTVAELPLSLKNVISHRARAYRNLAIECSNRQSAHPLFAALGAKITAGGHVE